MTDVEKYLGSPQMKRWAQAKSIKKLHDVDLPRLAVWNYDACANHETPTAECQYRACGGEPFRHQRVTASFSFFAKKTIVGNSTGTGKQQPVTEPVLTPTGWVPIGSLKVGDRVIDGATGLPTEVVGVFPQNERRTFKVTFNDGSWTLAGPDHLWLAGSKSRLHQGGKMKVVTTDQMRETIHRSWVVPMVPPVEYDPVELPADPYLVGVVLGDGAMTKYGTFVLCSDRDIAEAIGANITRSHASGSYTVYASVDRSLIGHTFPSGTKMRSWEKAVPEVFMMASPEQRLALLQGLLDTDGSPMRVGGVEFSTTSERLADQVVELTQSLGGVARKSAPRITHYTHKEEYRDGRPSWRVNVKVPQGMKPFRLQRKLDKWVEPTKYPARRIIKSIKQVEDQDSVCIKVAAESELYVTRNHIVTHNTSSALLSLALEHHTGSNIKCIAVVPTISVGQWSSEIKRWTPGFEVATIASKTPKKDRLTAYAKDWNILLMGYHSFTKDIDHITKLGIKQVIIDDVDPALNVQNATFKALEKICRPAEMVIYQNATSLSTKLEQLYAASTLLGAREVWGSLTNFRDTFVKKEKIWVRVKASQSNMRGVQTFTSGTGNKQAFRQVYQAVGYKSLNLFKRKFSPMFIRFTYEDLADDLTIPDLVTNQVYFDMTKKQRARYEELQSGVRTILNDKQMPASTKATNAMTAFTIGSQICSGTFSLKTTSGGYEKDGPEASPKLDWIMEQLENDWVGEKVVVYAKFRGAISALQSRLKDGGIKYSTVWGVVTDPEERKAQIDQFWEDPDTRVMIISVSGERSLNLQNASILVMWDLQLNPARVQQLAGRVRRVGSKHQKVFVFQLLHHDSQEERYMGALSTRQELFDFVFDEDSSNGDPDNALIQKMDPEELLKLISP